MKNNIRLLVEGFFDDEIFNKKDDIKTDLEDIGVRYYKIDPENPKYWQVGDILYSVYNYSMIIPYFYKIIKRTDKTFTLVELSTKLASGHYNGDFYEVPDDSKLENDLKGEQIRTKINKYGAVNIGSVKHLRLWDGKPVHGNDLD